MRIKKGKFSQNGEKLGVTLAEGYLAVYDVESCANNLTQTRMLNNAHSFGECEFFSDHEILTTRANTVRLYDLREKRVSKKYETVNPYDENTAARKIFELTCMSHTSFGLMAGSTTGDVFLWDHRHPERHIRKWNIANDLGLQARRNNLQCSNLVISSIGMDVYGAYFISPYSLNWIDI